MPTRGGIGLDIWPVCDHNAHSCHFRLMDLFSLRREYLVPGRGEGGGKRDVGR